MEHPFDYPAWNALISGNKNLSLGNEHVKYFDETFMFFRRTDLFLCWINVLLFTCILSCYTMIKNRKTV